MTSAVSFCKHNKRRILSILVFAVFFFASHANLANGAPPFREKVSVVVIDPGHGGRDPGAVGSKIMEKDVVLGIGLKLGKYIEVNFDDVKVIYTRDTDVFIPLDERAQIANSNKADLFISIHANSISKPTIEGTETFVMGISKDESNFEVAKKENSVITLEENYETKYEGFDPNSIDSYIIFSVMQKTYQGQSIAFAQLVEDEFAKRARRNSRGVKQDAFWVLWRTTMPSVLIETGFLTHSQEEKFLSSENGQEIIASAIFRAFRSYKESIESKSHFSESLVQQEEIILPKQDSPLVNSDDLYFKVQVLVSKTEIDSNDSYFKDYDSVEEFKNGSWYKYAVGAKKSYKEVLDYCLEVRKDFPDAFVIAVKNKQIISLKDALEEINY